MKHVLSLCIVPCMVLCPVVSHAYEPGTHRDITNVAVQQSVLVIPLSSTSTTLLQDLGLNAYTDGTQLFPDIQAGETQSPGPGASDFKAASAETVQDLFKAGAQLEDRLARPFNHFYDPVQGHVAPLQFTVGNITTTSSHSAPQWALNSTCPSLGPNNSYDPSGADWSPTNQCYSLQDALSYYRHALIDPDPNVRKQQFGDLFLTLGHDLHLLQDTAQPQHVRDDMHCDDDYVCPKGSSLHNPSFYEAYTFSHAKPANYVSYPVVNLPTAESYWDTSDKQGIAQFTNLNFVSAGTNFQLIDTTPVSGAKYDSPVPFGAGTGMPIETVYSTFFAGTPVPDQIAQVCPPTVCTVTFYAVDVQDNYPAANCPGSTLASKNCIDNYGSTDSIFDQDLKNFNVQVTTNGAFATSIKINRAFTLNAVNFKSDWDYLLARAIGYSAGLVNHFFRGRLSMHPDSSQPDGYVVTNQSTVPMSNGTLTVYYDAVDGSRYPVPKAVWTNVSMDKAGNDPADQFKIQIVPPAPPALAPANPGQYILVFNGTISDDQRNGEKGIAALQYTPGGDVYAGTNVQFAGNFEYPPGSEPNFVYEYAPDGTLVNSYSLVRGSVNAPIYMAVYNKTLYTMQSGTELGANVREYTYPGYGTSKVVAGGQNYYQAVNFGIAVNDSFLLVPTGQSVQNSYATTYSVSLYDHSGNFIRNISEPYLVESLSANDNHMCVSLNEWNQHNIATLVELQDMSGTVTSNLMNIPASDASIGALCASSRDRHYVLVQTLDSSLTNMLNTLYVYDDNGNQIASVPVTGAIANSGSFQLAADGRKVYISFDGYDYQHQFGGVVVVDRVITRKPDGSIATENYVQAPDIADGKTNVGIAVDFSTSD